MRETPLTLHRDAAAELLAQLGLQELAGRGMRQRVHEDHVVGHPPFGDARRQEVENAFLRRIRAGLGMDDQQRPLLPFLVRNGDDGRLEYVGCNKARFSISIDEIHSPPDLMTSFRRSVS